MRKQTVKISIIASIFTLLASHVLAAPTIDSTSGEFIHGQSMTISGSEFASKQSGNPVVWDNFDGQPLGPIAGKSPIVGPAWGDFHCGSDGDICDFSDADSHSGDKSVFIRWDASSQNAITSWFGNTDAVYVTWWAYQHWDDGLSYDELNNKFSPDTFSESVDYAVGTRVKYNDGSGTKHYDCLVPGAHIWDNANWQQVSIMNRKWFYIFSGSSGANLPQAMPLIPAGSSTWGVYDNNSNMPPETYNTANSLPSNDNVTYADTDGVWQRWEYWLKLDSAGDAYDGVVKWWLSGRQQTDITNYGWRDAGDTDLWNNIMLGNMWQGMESSLTKPHVYFDDVYMDFSQARVEIGNAPVFADCTHREIQIPSAWGDTGITFTANQGSFSNSSAYLFVVDENGDPSAGYPITLSSTEDVTAPASPSGLLVM